MLNSDITISTNRQKQLSTHFQIHEDYSFKNTISNGLNLTIMLGERNYKEKNDLQKLQQINHNRKGSITSINFPCKSKFLCLFLICVILATILIGVCGGLGWLIAQNYRFSEIDTHDRIAVDQQKQQKQQQLKPQPQPQPQPQIRQQYSTLSTQNYKIRLQFRKNTPIPNSLKNDRYDLIRSIDQILQHNGFKQGKITPQYQRAIRLLQVTHNVNINGQFIFDHYDYYKTPQQKYRALKKILDQQKQYYQTKYQISKYKHDQIRFCIAIVSYNNAQRNRLYLRNLDSIFQQDYQNYHVVYVDDVSTDGQVQYIKNYIKDNKIPQDKITLVQNKQKQGGSKNFINIGHNYCQLGQIMTFIDGDDSLVGRQVFSLLNAIYQRDKPALTFGQFIQVSTYQRYQIKTGPGWAHKIQLQHIKNLQYRKSWFFFTCHLKTLYVDLFRKIQLKDFQYDNGTYINHSTDVVIMIPAVQMVEERAIYVDEILYEYNKGPGMGQAGAQQRFAHDYIRFKPNRKQRLANMSFADNPITKHYA